MNEQRVLPIPENPSLHPRHQGALAERLASLALQAHPYWRSVIHRIVSWAEFAREHNLRPTDTGIDRVAITKDGKNYAVQVKYRTDAKDGALSWNELATFYGQYHALSDHFSGAILITNAALTQTAEQLLQGAKIIVLPLEDTDIEKTDIAPTEAPRAPLTLHPFQQEAVDAIITAFNNGETRGKLIMPPGTGKTLVALRVAERLSRRTLFLAPSIALLDQSLRAWLSQATEGHAISAFAVVSDTSVGRTDDRDLNALSLLSMPATTTPEALAKGVRAHADAPHLVVFCTYQSVEVVAEAQAKHELPEFDLIVFDEAHRTAQARRGESAFTLAHHNDRVKARLRLYMTATPRVWEVVGEDRQSLDMTVYSMDDERVYGRTLYEYSFRRAVDEQYLADYRIIVLSVAEDAQKAVADYLNRGRENGSALMDVPRVLKTIGLLKVLNGEVKDKDGEPVKVDIRTGIVFHNTIKHSLQLQKELLNVRHEAQRAGLLQSGDKSIAIRHLDGNVSMSYRRSSLDWLRERQTGEQRLITNAKLLTEGIDVPALDAVVFLDPRDSVVDIIQATGRVMRKAEGKKYGYIIIPAIVTKDGEELEESSYRTIWQVLSALKAVDSSFPARLRAELTAYQDDGQGGRRYTDEERARQEMHSEASAIPQQLVFDLLGNLSDDNRRIIKALSGKLIRQLRLGRAYLTSWAERVSDIARRMDTHIRAVVEQQRVAREALENLINDLRKLLNETVNADDAIAMLVQHLLTKPIFDALFVSLRATRQDAVSQSLDRLWEVFAGYVQRETADLEGFYEEMRLRAQGLKGEDERAEFLREVYDNLFKQAFPSLSDEMGIAYTPVALVDYLVRSADVLAQKHFEVRLGDAGVRILEPFAGTGTFVVRLMHHIAESQGVEALMGKLDRGELVANEILLLPYHVMRANAESTYLALTGEYRPFGGAYVADSFRLAELQYASQDLGKVQLFPDEYISSLNEQVKRPVQVILTNPPWRANAGKEGATRKNPVYKGIRERISSTYVETSKNVSGGQLKYFNSLYDQYIQALRIATDRIGDYGIIGMVLNNGWLSGIAAKGLRACMAQEFAEIYVYDLRGNTRTRGKQLRDEGDKVFPSTRTGVCLVLLVKNKQHQGNARIYLYRMEDGLKREEKLDRISREKSVAGTPWQQLSLEAWIGQETDSFKAMTPLTEVFFTKNMGLVTRRDAYAYNPSRGALERHMRRLIETYNAHVQRVRSREITKANIEDKIEKDESLIKWDEELKRLVLKGNTEEFERSGAVYEALYRPFFYTNLYFSRTLLSRTYKNELFWVTSDTRLPALCVNGPGSQAEFLALATRRVADQGVASSSFLYPLYTYANSEEASSSLFSTNSVSEYRSNIRPDFVRKVAQACNLDVAGLDEAIFYYIYAILNHPAYAQRFSNDLRQSEPRIPIPPTANLLQTLAQYGKKLFDLHADWDVQPSWDWNRLERDHDKRMDKVRHSRVPDVVLYIGKPDESDWFVRLRVNRLKLDQTQRLLSYNDWTKITNIPESCFVWKPAGLAPLDWMCRYYSVETKVEAGKGPAIVWDINERLRELGNPKWLVDAMGSAITVSVETVTLHAAMESVVNEVLDSVSAPESSPEQ